MGEERQNVLELISTESDELETFNYDEIINNFAEAKVRKITFK